MIHQPAEHRAMGARFQPALACEEMIMCKYPGLTRSRKTRWRTFSSIAALFSLLISGCADKSDPPWVDVGIVNRTTNDIAWSVVWLGTNKLEFGAVGLGQKWYLDYQYPITAKATVKITNSQQEEKQCDVDLNNIWPLKKSGKLSFEITTNGIVPRFVEKVKP